MVRHDVGILVVASGIFAGGFATFSGVARAASEVAPVPAPAPAITRQQLDSFAELLGEPRPVVWQRLQLDPGLVPFAAAAADERMSRKSTGKIMTITGFSILGVGVIGGYVIMLSSIADTGCTYDGSCSNDMGRRLMTGLVVILASTGVGLGIGIPGIVKMARQSEIETDAVDRYHYPGSMGAPMPYAPAQSALSPAKAWKLPLLAFTF
jgi:hypothetical protein